MHRYRISDYVWFAFFALLRPEVVKDERPRKYYADPDGIYPLLSTKRICSSVNPTVACEARVLAYKRSEFFADLTLGYWHFSEDHLPSVREPVDKAIWQEDRGNYAGEPFEWTCCPFCGEDLPPISLLKQTLPRKKWDK